MAGFSKRSLDNQRGVHPHLCRVLNAAILTSPIDFTIVAGVRSTAEQQKLYRQGRSLPGPIVTNSDGVRSKSNHQVKSDGWGYAIDFYPYYNGSVQVNAPFKLFESIARHILDTAEKLGYPLEWGGDWKRFRDAPHIELKSDAEAV